MFLVLITQLYHDERFTQCRILSFTLWPIQPPRKTFEVYVDYKAGLEFKKKRKLWACCFCLDFSQFAATCLVFVL